MENIRDSNKAMAARRLKPRGGVVTAELNGARLPHLHVLLIDHDPAAATQLRSGLGHSRAGGALVEYAATLPEAIKRLSASRFDAILLDLDLPDSPGVSALHTLKPAANGAPILALAEDETLAPAAIQAGAFDYLSRSGVDSGLIVRLLRYAVERHRVEEELRRTNAELQGWIDELEQRNRDMTLLVEMQELLQACTDSEEAYAVFSRFASDLFPGTSGALYIMNPSRSLLLSVSAWGDSPPGERMFGPDECWAVRRGRIHSVEDNGARLVCRHLVHQGHPAPALSLCVPMMAQGQAAGVLTLHPDLIGQPPAAHRGWSQAQRQFAQTVTEQLAMTLANLRLREVLRSQAIRDPLTGLFNRRYMEETLVRELHRAVRRETQLSIVLMDLDFFKATNDKYGHAAGDALLRELGSFLESHIRGEDIACRYGGEEFILILPDSSLEATVGRARQINEGVARMQVRNRDEIIGPVTLSLGVAAYPRHGTTVEALLAAADRALYAAKAGGRNRVVVAEDIDPESTEWPKDLPES